jgi:cytochrome c oxidase cbb3-type subunit 4
MDVNDLRIAVTLLSFGIFIGIAVWAWSRRNAARFDEAAQLPFMDSVDPDRAARATNGTAAAAGDRPMVASGGGAR